MSYTVTYPGWIVFPAPDGQFWEINTSMLIALVRAHVIASYPPDLPNSAMNLWVAVGMMPQWSHEHQGRLPPRTVMIEEKVSQWLRQNRNAILNNPQHFLDNVLPKMRDTAHTQNLETMRRANDFSYDIVDHLRTVNRDAPNDTEKAKVEAALVALAKVAIVTGAIVLPMGWAALAVAGGSALLGGYKLYRTGDGHAASKEFLSTALSAIPSARTVGGMRLFLLSATTTGNALLDYEERHDFGSALISATTKIGVSILGITSAKMVASSKAALLEGQLTQAEHQTTLLVLSGFDHAVSTTADTLTGVVNGQSFERALVESTTNALVGAGTGHVGKKLAQYIAGPLADNSIVGAKVGLSGYLHEFTLKLTAKGADEARAMFTEQIDRFVVPGMSSASSSGLTFALDFRNQTLKSKPFVEANILRKQKPG